MSKELFKTIEAQGRLITELRAENEQLKWQVGSELVDLREENELLRTELEKIKSLASKIVTYYYESEQTHYEEYEDEDKPQDHIFLTLLKLEDELYKNQSNKIV